MRTEKVMETKGPRPEEQNRRSVTRLTIRGMTCGNCVRHATEAIQAVHGVSNAAVTLENGQASVRWDMGAKEDGHALIHAVEEAGYEAALVGSCGHAHDQVERKLAGWQLNLWIGVLGTLPLMIGEWVFGLGTVPWFQRLSFVLAGAVQVFGGGPFYRG